MKPYCGIWFLYLSVQLCNCMDIFNRIQRHLASATKCIRIYQGTYAFDTGKRKHQYLIFKSDIDRLANGSIKDFLYKIVPESGFSGSVTIQFKRKNGSSFSEVERTTLTYKEENNTKTYMDTMGASHTSNHSSLIQSNHNHLPPPSYSPYGMGVTPVAMEELTSLRVIKERYDDVVRERNNTEQELLDAKSELRKEKELHNSLKIKYDTLEEKNALALQRKELETKSFADSEGFKTLIEGLGQTLPTLIKSSQPSGLGMPGGGISETKREWLAIIADDHVTDEDVLILKNVLHTMVQKEGFTKKITQLIQEIWQK